MTVSQLHQQAMTSGILSVEEIHWLARHRDSFTDTERQVVIRLIRLLQRGALNLGCHLASGA
ncbi:hypothetical protein [Cyanobium sp. NIES-981]|uniref:hypothetical protein n=1 Tax=Cyanobium sp. NIES-981 TaxID=1851505 RepID=UPI000B35190C|nr:hypothetical protein [Cyanobium sp. NIES-981]